jgi:CheY-like chemotaxis protein
MAKEMILIVDDSLLIRKITQATLQKQGYVVLQAGDGREGVNLARREKPALVLMDLEMPEMGGLEALAQLKADALTSAIPVVILSGSDAVADRRQVLASGALEMLPKPVDPATLVSLVSQILGES